MLANQLKCNPLGRTAASNLDRPTRKQFAYRRTPQRVPIEDHRRTASFSYRIIHRKGRLSNRNIPQTGISRPPHIPLAAGPDRRLSCTLAEVVLEDKRYSTSP